MDDEAELSKIVQRDDLAGFVETLQKDLLQNPDEWENWSLNDYLGSLARWLEDTDNRLAANYPIARKLEWRTFGEMLLAAKYYE